MNSREEKRWRRGERSKRQQKEAQDPYCGRYEPERWQEIEQKYAKNGWTRVEGELTLGWISQCGRWFNFYSKLTGNLYNVGPMERYI